jgi:2-polyprenyl-6-methoxyphenol hydroxylase-like FAD-dependent oxidoreductase
LPCSRRGVKHVLIDKLSHGQNASRATVIRAHTFEVLDALGVSQALAARGLKVTKVGI